MNSRASFLAAITAAVLAASALAGCSDDADAPEPEWPVGASYTPPSETSSGPSTPPDVSGALQVIDRGGRVTCAEVTGASHLGLWVASVRATVALRIDGVQRTGGAADAVGGVAVPVRDPAAYGGMFSDWPPTAPTGRLAKSVDWAARSNLAGLHLDAGEEVRVVLHVVGAPGATLERAELAFAVDDGDIGSSVVLPVGLRFARHCSS